jgi:hypothetical protein
MCLFGSGKQIMSECKMIYIHWPGYYPTEESYFNALINLCPNMTPELKEVLKKKGRETKVEKIIVFVKSLFRFILWAWFASAELNEYDANDYSAMVAFFAALGIASIIIPIITFFARHEYFNIVATVCSSIYFLVGFLFCWFLKSQYGYRFLAK